MVNLNPRIIVAIDKDSSNSADRLVRKLSPDLCRLKVGLELFSVCGPNIVQKFQRMGYSVFVDLKIHDIPNTCYRTVRALTNLGVWMISVHVSGGREMLLAASEAVEGIECSPLIVGISVLTSLEAKSLNEIGIDREISEHVNKLSVLASNCNIDGIVCAPSEILIVRKKLGIKFKIVTPGIRPTNNLGDDQKRISSAQSAIKDGSDYIVIGRPITDSKYPKKVLEDLSESIYNVD